MGRECGGDVRQLPDRRAPGRTRPPGLVKLLPGRVAAARTAGTNIQEYGLHCRQRSATCPIYLSLISAHDEP